MVRLEVFLKNAKKEQIEQLIALIKAVNEKEFDKLIQSLENMI